MKSVLIFIFLLGLAGIHVLQEEVCELLPLVLLKLCLVKADVKHRNVQYVGSKSANLVKPVKLINSLWLVICNSLVCFFP